MAWVMLALSVVFETFADTSMKLSEGFAKKKWLIGMVAGYLCSFYFLSQVIMQLPFGLSYAVWSSAAIVLTVIVGRAIWNESISRKKVLGIALIIAGIILLRLGVA